MRGPGDVHVAVVGAGRIGLPWAAVLASDRDISVTCVDVDDARVRQVNEAEAPFSEPGLQERLETARDEGQLRATTNESAVADADYVAVCLNARRNQMHAFLDAFRAYTRHLTSDTTVIMRVTLPVEMIDRAREIVAETDAEGVDYVTFPERLAEGKAIEEIHSLPKIVGVDGRRGREKMETLLSGFDCELRFTDQKTAMFVKLIDNSYRDALFAIANQIGFIATESGLDAHEAIELANHEYPRNDIPSPGTVGGKCLPKDPHFLTDEQVYEQPTTPDLFMASRFTNATVPDHIVDDIATLNPSRAAILGLSFKRGVADTNDSPAMTIKQKLERRGVTVEEFDPHLHEWSKLRSVLEDCDTVVLAVNHDEFAELEDDINRHTSTETVVYDVWGDLDEERLERRYTGFGIGR